MNQGSKPVVFGPITFQILEVYFSHAGAMESFSHDLGLIPRGSIVLGIDKPCIIYRGQMPPASNVLNLVCDTDAVTATILVLALNLTER
jgi:hypothetical protein